MLKIYVASSWRNTYQEEVVKRLEKEETFLVYDFKNPPNNSAFHWSSIDSNWKSWSVSEFTNGLQHPLAWKGFEEDFIHLKDADAVVLVLPCGRSAHLGAGWAKGAGKRVVVYAPEPCEPELMYKMTGPYHRQLRDGG